MRYSDRRRVEERAKGSHLVQSSSVKRGIDDCPLITPVDCWDGTIILEAALRFRTVRGELCNSDDRFVDNCAGVVESGNVGLYDIVRSALGVDAS